MSSLSKKKDKSADDDSKRDSAEGKGVKKFKKSLGLDSASRASVRTTSKKGGKKRKFDENWKFFILLLLICYLDSPSRGGLSVRSDVPTEMSRSSVIDHRGRELDSDRISEIDLDKLLNAAIKK